MKLLLLLCALAARPAGAQEAGTGTVHLAVFRQTQFTLAMPTVYPFERMLREGATGFTLLRVENVMSHFNGDSYMYRLPPWLQEDAAPAPAPASEAGQVAVSSVRVLETSSGFFTMVPDSPLFDRVRELSSDPASYRLPMQPRARVREAEFTRTELPDGGGIHSLRIPGMEEESYPQWRNTVALVYRLRKDDREHKAVFIYKTLGGQARRASALDALREKHGASLLVLNRGDAFEAEASTGSAPAAELESLGVKACAAGAGELANLSHLLDYGSRRPDGVRFLSANLVYSSAPTQSVLAPYHVFRAAGKRVAVLGLTRLDARRFIEPARAGSLTIEEPVSAARRHVRAMREAADVVVALTNLGAADNARLRESVRGLDLILGDELPYPPDDVSETVEVRDRARNPYDGALHVSMDGQTFISHLELRHSAESLSVVERRVSLDESLPDKEGYPDLDPEAYGVQADTRAAILPSARRLYQGRPDAAAFPRLEDRHFWNLAGSLVADRTQAEAAILPVFGVLLRTTGDFPEALVREWFRWQDALVTFELPGRALSALVSEARSQEARDRLGLGAPAGQMRIAVGGVAGDMIHGIPIDPNTVYKVAGTERLLSQTSQFPALAGARNVRPMGPLRDAVIQELRRRADEQWPVERYRELLDGRPVGASGLWRVNFREIGVNLSNTKVVRDDAFSRVPNSRVQGFDQLLIGGAAKTDIDYLRSSFKWANSLELEYSRSRLKPPGQPPVINTPNNRVSALTVGTVRVGSFPWRWVGTSYGPSLGAQYEGQVEKTPGLRRRQIYSLYPGVELFGGSFVRSLTLSANIKRDVSRVPANSQYGLRQRSLFSSAVGSGRLNGELWANYFVRTGQDTEQDLLWEGDLNLKLQFPILRHLSIGPFFDLYFFSLKVRPLAGYSAITGITIGFSRLWKPQYEEF